MLSQLVCHELSNNETFIPFLKGIAMNTMRCKGITNPGLVATFVKMISLKVFPTLGGSDECHLALLFGLIPAYKEKTFDKES